MIPKNFKRPTEHKRQRPHSESVHVRAGPMTHPPLKHFPIHVQYLLEILLNWRSQESEFI
jgi:hypothetical protein